MKAQKDLQNSKKSAVTNNDVASLKAARDQRKIVQKQQNLSQNSESFSENNKIAQLQEMAHDQSSAKGEVVQQKANKTGLPNQLKSGIESLSGYSMDDVKVHYNSSKPAQLQAHAFAQGTNIHLASGQEKHLPHEAWHVVQQKQGRVAATKQLKSAVNINDDPHLEREADVMGFKALQMQAYRNSYGEKLKPKLGASNPSNRPILQGMFYEYNPHGDPIFHYGPVIHMMWAEKLNDQGVQEMDGGYGVWVRKFTQAHTEQLLRMAPQIQQIVHNMDAGMQHIQAVVGDQHAAIHNLQQAQHLAQAYAQELENSLKKFAGFVLVGIGLGAGVAALANYFLSLPAIPWQAKAAIDAAGLIYGAYVSYRWMKSDLLPKLSKAILVPANTGMWALTIYTIVSELLAGSGFNSVHIAAMPFAITIELILLHIKRKAEEMMRAPAEDDHLLGARQNV